MSAAIGSAKLTTACIVRFQIGYVLTLETTPISTNNRKWSGVHGQMRHTSAYFFYPYYR